jgi:glycosyltransferase involved in cell wall biosynthesis
LIIGQLVPSEPKIPEQITTAISQRQLDGKVIWAGYQEGVPQILKSLTIFCLTSDYEGSPNVIVEAMAAGLPIVATSVGDLPDIIKNSQQGFLVEPGDTTGIARAINKLLDDPELRRKMGQAARAWVKDNTNAQAISWRFASFYRSAIKQNTV